MEDKVEIESLYENEIEIPISDETSLPQEEIEVLINTLMENVLWLWRKASPEDIIHAESNGSKNFFINSNAYKLKNINGEIEKTISLFEINDKYKATKESLLNTEAECFVIFLIGEVRCEKKEIAPISLIKRKLIENINNDNSIFKYLKSIKKTEPESNNFFFAKHWDIFPSSYDEEMLNNLYNILSKSSVFCTSKIGTDITLIKEFGKNLSEKRRVEKDQQQSRTIITGS